MHYDEHALRARVDAALRTIRRVLDNTRHPQYPADVPHRYDDKYMLAEVATRITIASLLQSLEVVGLTGDQLAKLQTWAKSRAVTIRLTAQEDCRFDRETTRKVESGEERVTETRGLLGRSTKSEKVVTTIVEYFWAFDFKYQIVAFQGTASDQAITLHARAGHIEIKTTTKDTPRPKTKVRPAIDVDLTWILAHLGMRRQAGARRSPSIARTPIATRRGATRISTRRSPRSREPRRVVPRRRVVLLRGPVPGAVRARPRPSRRSPTTRSSSSLQVPAVRERPAGWRRAVPRRVHERCSAARRGAAQPSREKCRALQAAFPRDATIVTAVEAGLIVTCCCTWRACATSTPRRSTTSRGCCARSSSPPSARSSRRPTSTRTWSSTAGSCSCRSSRPWCRSPTPSGGPTTTPRACSRSRPGAATRRSRRRCVAPKRSAP